jgi:glycosyltransferase involved in cell wall biosynthesis
MSANGGKDLNKVSLIVSDLAGGGVIRAFLLAQAIEKLNYAVEIVGFLSNGEIYALPNYPLIVKSIRNQHYPGFLKSAWQLIRQIEGDILYALKPKPSSFGVAWLKKVIRQNPLLLDMDDWEMSWHGGDDWRYRPSLKQFYRDTLKPGGQLRNPDHPLYVNWMEGVISQADAVTIDTHFLQQRFGGTYVPNGKDTDWFNPEDYDAEQSRELYGLADFHVLMFPGAPRPHKGVEDVLEALNQLGNPRLRLVIVGGSPYDNYDQTLIDRWGNWIIKLPRYSVQQMPSVLAAAHAVVVPQRDTLTARAQFPLKITDGMSMAKPVISTFVGDIPEILGGTGYLVDPGAPEQLAEKIQWLFFNIEEAQHQGKRARQRCVERYSIQAMASQLAAVLP